MIEPGQHLLHRLDRRDLRQRRAFQHDHREMKRPSRCDLAVGPFAAAVLGDQRIDAVALEQSVVVGLAEGPARGDIDRVRHGERRIHRIDAAHEISVLGRGGEGLNLFPPKRQEDTTRRFPKGLYRVLDRICLDPKIALDRAPRWAPQCQEGDSRQLRGLRRICRDDPGVRVRHIDQRIDALIAKIIGKPSGAAEAPDPDRGRLRQWLRRAPGKGERHGEFVEPGERPGEQPGPDRAAKDEDALDAR